MLDAVVRFKPPKVGCSRHARYCTNLLVLSVSATADVHYNSTTYAKHCIGVVGLFVRVLLAARAASAALMLSIESQSGK